MASSPHGKGNPRGAWPRCASRPDGPSHMGACAAFFSPPDGRKTMPHLHFRACRDFLHKKARTFEGACLVVLGWKGPGTALTPGLRILLGILPEVPKPPGGYGERYPDEWMSIRQSSVHPSNHPLWSRPCAALGAGGRGLGTRRNARPSGPRRGAERRSNAGGKTGGAVRVDGSMVAVRQVSADPKPAWGG